MHADMHADMRADMDASSIQDFLYFLQIKYCLYKLID